MNDFNLYQGKKFWANYDYPLYTFKKVSMFKLLTILTISDHVLCEIGMFVKFFSKEKEKRKSENVVAKQLYK